MQNITPLILASVLIWQLASAFVQLNVEKHKPKELLGPIENRSALKPNEKGDGDNEKIMEKEDEEWEIKVGQCEKQCLARRYIQAPPPVCGDGTNYPDECRANCSGAENIVIGRCPCECPKNYNPVCGDGTTYENECQATCAEAKNIVPGRCPCKCPENYNPVCGDGTTYENKCLATCAEAKNIVKGKCPCICPKIYNPVCCDGLTYPNKCLARCASTKKITNGPC